LGESTPTLDTIVNNLIFLAFAAKYYNCFFSFFNLLCCHTGDHPQGDLAMFGYRPAMKVGISFKSFFNLSLLEQCVNNMAILNIKFFFLHSGLFRHKKFSLQASPS
jgi:hypothetical protein